MRGSIDTPIFSCNDNSLTPLVDKMIGNAYINVKKVADNIDKISYLADNIDTVNIGFMKVTLSPTTTPGIQTIPLMSVIIDNMITFTCMQVNTNGTKTVVNTVGTVHSTGLDIYVGNDTLIVSILWGIV